MTAMKKILLSLILVLIAGASYSQFVVNKEDTTFFNNDSVIFITDNIRGALQWQVSKDSINWNNIQGATYDSLIIKVDSSAVYRLMAKEGTCDPVYGDTMFVKKNTNPVVGKFIIVLEPDVWAKNIDSTKIDSIYLPFHSNAFIGKTLGAGYYLVTEAGEGALYRITNVTTRNDSTLLNVVPASLADIIEQGKISFVDTLAAGTKGAMEIEYLAKGVQFKGINEKGDWSGITFSLNHILYDKDDDLENTTYDQIRINGSFSIDPTIKGDFEFINGQVKSLNFKFDVKEDVALTGEVGILNGDFNPEAKLASIKIPKIRILVLGVPVIINPKLEILAGMLLDANGNLTTSVTQHFEYTTGFSYSDGKTTFIRVMKKSAEFDPVSIDVEASARTYISTILTLKFYKSIAPYLEGTIYGELVSGLITDPKWELYAGADLRAGLEVEIFDRTLFEISTDVLSYRKLMDHAPSSQTDLPPNAKFITEPNLQLVNQPVIFKTEECTDDIDLSSDMEYRWDWEGDGNWDTSFTRQTSFSHSFSSAGAYNVKLEAKDSGGNISQVLGTVRVESNKNIIGNHPPIAILEINPKFGSPTTNFSFDASRSFDVGTYSSNPQYRFDFTGDGVFDTKWSPYRIAFSKIPSGYHTAKLQVKDSDGNITEANVTYSVIETGRVIDIEGNAYKTVKIGTQTWMAENLKTSKFKNGDLILNVTDYASWISLTSGAYCWYNNDPIRNRDTYGALYNWYAVNSGLLCPTGWHVPTDYEWTILTDFLGGEPVAGGKLKETGATHWGPLNYWATNETGFTALPGGIRVWDGGFLAMPDAGYWWSATEDTNSIPWHREIWWSDTYVYRRNVMEKHQGLSIRCIKD